MAVPITLDEMRDNALSILDEVFKEGWAVYFQYFVADMTTRIGKVEPWCHIKHYGRSGILRIVSARDELEAYTKALEIINARNHV